MSDHELLPHTVAGIDQAEARASSLIDKMISTYRVTQKMPGATHASTVGYMALGLTAGVEDWSRSDATNFLADLVVTAVARLAQQ